MKCPNCGAAKLAHDTRDMPYNYKGEETTIPAVRGDYCPACSEAVLDMGESVYFLRHPELLAVRAHRGDGVEQKRAVRQKFKSVQMLADGHSPG